MLIITAIGSQALPSDIPRDVDFSSFIPCVSGMMSATF
jgi:hypothetical protein